jgi:type IV pilus assembly protein PilC
MSKVRGAMTYPIIVLVVISGVMAFMMFAVMPQVKGLYEDMKLNLPFITKVLIKFTEFVGKWWWLVVVIIAAIVYYTRRYFKTESGIKFKDSMKLNVPLFKGMLRKLYMSRFLRTGQTLLSTGVPMLDTLAICGKAVNNYWVEQSITRAADKVKGGKALSFALKSEEYILVLVPQMIKIGEQSGKIDEMMGRAADVYEKELDEEISNLSKVIEPALMVVLALMAGLMVGAILIPIYGMVGDINV